MISNTHCGFYSLTRIITERFDNIKMNEFYYYLKEVTKKETTQNKVDKLPISLQRDNQKRQ